MLKFNLLPPEEKRKIELMNFSHLAAFIGVWFFVILVVFTLLLASAYFSLFILSKSQYKLIESRKTEEKAQRLIKMEEKIKQTNQRLSQMHLKQKELILWTPILEELAEITPSGIYLTNLSQTTDNQIRLSGWANKRDIMLNFQSFLEQSSRFTDIEAPLSNLLKQTDIDFVFNFKPVQQ